MSIPGDASPLLLGGGGPQQYKIERSLRFNSSDSAYLSRTPASAGNRKTWTWSGWAKRSGLGNVTPLFSSNINGAGNPVFFITIESDKLLALGGVSGVSVDYEIITQAVFRDCSAWMHIVYSFDSTVATAADRTKLYVNGARITAFNSTPLYPSLDYQGAVNNVYEHRTGRNAGSSYGDFYLADINFIDGQALDPTSFAETNITTGQWVPKAFTGTYGTNGFRLAFADNSNNTATTLGKDSSGNGNNWTPNNLSVTAGAGNDSLVDTPTSYGTDTGAGGEVRGNYATLNPLVNPGGSTLSNGNLDCVTENLFSGRVVGTIAVSSGKWYWEVVKTGGSAGQLVGIAPSSEYLSSEPGRTANSYGYYTSGQKYNNATLSSYGASWTTNDIIGVALDLDAGTLVFYKNGVSQGTAFSGLSGSFVAAVSDDTGGGGGSTNFSINFGQRPFAYTAPSGFKALCDTNLPAPVVAKPNSVFDVKLYTGNGSTQTISGLGFSPDLVWIKSRSSSVWWNLLFDQIRGAGKWLSSNATDAEAGNGSQLLTAFTSGGFSLNLDPNGTVNANGDTYVAWAWDAGSSTVTNTQGSITSQVRANASAGFSIVTYTGNGSSATVGHGLGISPSFVIVKKRSSSENWLVWFTGFGVNEYLYLNATNAKNSFSGTWGSLPTSSLFGVFDQSVNASGQTFVAYCFAPVNSYSSFGSFTGNGSADGPFVYTGFRPRWVILKCSSATSSWAIHDSARATYNVVGPYLLANTSDAEASVDQIDFLSNGFKLRNTGFTNGSTWIYAAFAENPFQYARAR